MGSIYCPYSDRDIDEAASRPEHIIPKSLGGSGEFAIPIAAKFNHDVGSAIDGAIANDPLVSLRRSAYSAKGHSGKSPMVEAKRSRLVETNEPVQIKFGAGGPVQIWDPIGRRRLTAEEVAGRKFESEVMLDRFSRLKFAAKVALSGGYFIYGDLFRAAVNHHELRALLNLSRDTKREEFAEIGLRGYDEFSAVDPNHQGQGELWRFLCSRVVGSCLLAIPGPRNVGFVIGILGQYMAELNVEAHTAQFPTIGDHDRGHAVILRDRRMTRMSFQKFLAEANEALAEEERREPGDNTVEGCQ